MTVANLAQDTRLLPIPTSESLTSGRGREIAGNSNGAPQDEFAALMSLLGAVEPTSAGTDDPRPVDNEVSPSLAIGNSLSAQLQAAVAGAQLMSAVGTAGAATDAGAIPTACAPPPGALEPGALASGAPAMRPEASAGTATVKVEFATPEPPKANAGAAGQRTPTADTQDATMPRTPVQSWVTGPYAAAALSTGAVEERPMQLAVVNVATHFAPIVAKTMATDGKDGIARSRQSETVAAEFAVLAPPAATTTAPDRDGGPSSDRGRRAALPVPESKGPATPDAMPAGTLARGPTFLGHDVSTAGASPRAEPAPVEIAVANEAAVQIPTAVADGGSAGVVQPVVKQIVDDLVRPGSVPWAGVAPAALDQKPLSKLKVMEIQLKPDSLGTVTVRMSLKDDVLELHLQAVHAETADLIRRDRDVLATLLRSAGYGANEAEIRVSVADSATASLMATASSTATAAAASPDASSSGGSTSGWGQSQAGSQNSGERSTGSRGRDEGTHGNREQDQRNKRNDVGGGAPQSGTQGLYL